MIQSIFKQGNSWSLAGCLEAIPLVGVQECVLPWHAQSSRSCHYYLDLHLSTFGFASPWLLKYHCEFIQICLCVVADLLVCCGCWVGVCVFVVVVCLFVIVVVLLCVFGVVFFFFWGGGDNICHFRTLSSYEWWKIASLTLCTHSMLSPQTWFVVMQKECHVLLDNWLLRYMTHLQLTIQQFRLCLIRRSLKAKGVHSQTFHKFCVQH